MQLVAFNILSLPFIFAILITVYLGVVLFGLILFGMSVIPGPGGLCFLSPVKEIFGYYVLKYVFSLFSFWDPYNANVVCLMLF